MGTNVSLVSGGALVAIGIAGILLTAHTGPSLASTCASADPAVVSAVVAGMQWNDRLDRYTLRVKVANLGSEAQAPNTRQSVAVYKGGTKLDSRGIPALRSGQSYTFNYATSRSAQAGAQTLQFRMDVQASGATHDCGTTNTIAMVRF